MSSTLTAAPKATEFVIVKTATGAVVGTIFAQNAVEAFLAARRDTHLPAGILIRKMPTDAGEIAAVRSAVAAFETGDTQTVQTVPEPQQEQDTMPKVKTSPVPKSVKPVAAKPASKAPVKEPTKVVPKAATAPTVVAKAAAPEANGHSGRKKEGLRKPQVKILKALLASKGPLSRRRIAEAVSADPKRLTDVAEPMGTVDEAARPAQDARLGYPTLLSLKLIHFKELSLDGHSETVYELTAAGRKAAEKAV